MKINTLIRDYYSQIEKDATNILEYIRGQLKYPYADVIKQFTNDKSSLDFNNFNEVELCIESLKTFITEKCEKIDPEFALPRLIQVYTNFYSIGPRDPVWLGIAVKSTVTFIWGNIKKQSFNNNEDNLTLLKEVILLVSALENLENSLYLRWFINEPFKLNEEGIQGSKQFHEAMNEIYTAFNEGLLQRTWKDYSQVFLSSHDEALKAVEKIISGESPKKQQIFKNTIFGSIGGSEPFEFWAGIWARLHLALISAYKRNEGTSGSDIIGVTLLPDSAFIKNGITIDINKQRKLQNSIMELFWNNTWYQQNNNLSRKEMLIYRPILRIRENNTNYTTSFFLLMDSLGNFIENSIMGYEGSSVRLSQKFREKFISEHFEKRIIDKFRAAGFISGSVLTNGEWRIGETTIQLNVKGQSLRGQVDVVAYHSEKKILVILECKVYELPGSHKQMRNLLKKFGIGDKSKINKKLCEKVDWLKQTDYFYSKELTSFHGFILDRRFPGMFHDDFLVLDEKLLDELIIQLLSYDGDTITLKY
ncbi:hypothetical protein [Lysinibacillus sp. 38-6]|uniref:hypothetical protein n=1 Tax=Lysinibacillus sp. 38-6 TaxID=3385991 RepID=UPI0039089E0D